MIYSYLTRFLQKNTFLESFNYVLNLPFDIVNQFYDFLQLSVDFFIFRQKFTGYSIKILALLVNS